MKIKWYGTASICIQSQDTKLMFDPYFKYFNPDLPAFPKEELKEADAILITHPHFDHFADIAEVLTLSSCKVYVCRRGFEIAEALGISTDRFQEIHAGDHLDFGNIHLTVYQGKHCVFDRGVVRSTLHQSLIPGHLHQGIQIKNLNRDFRIGEKDIFGYLLEADDRRTFLMGSANADFETVYPHPVDMLVYPYQGRSHMPEYSAKFLPLFEPACIFFDHFDDAFPPISSQMNCCEFTDFLKQYSPKIKTIIPTENQWY